MRYYETLYLLKPNLTDEDYQDTVNKFNNLIDQYKGVRIKVDEWGKKTLAYEVKKFSKGFYILVHYCGEPEINDKLNRAFKLDDKVLKYQTIKLSDNANLEELKPKEDEGAEIIDSENKEQVILNQEADNGV